MTAAANGTCAGIILCGGRSRRMGRSKAWLPFGSHAGRSELLLQRMVRIVREVIADVVMVSAAGQQLPPLAGDVTVVTDRHDGRGPLEGLAAGLAALPAHVSAAFVTSCDAPLLRSGFIQRMIELHQQAGAGAPQTATHSAPCITVPNSGGQRHPLAAVYDRTVLRVVEEQLAADQLRMMDLLERLTVREVGEAELQDIDPKLLSLQNLNRPEEYEAALAAMKQDQAAWNDRS